MLTMFLNYYNLYLKGQLIRIQLPKAAVWGGNKVSILKLSRGIKIHFKLEL